MNYLGMGSLTIFSTLQYLLTVLGSLLLKSNILHTTRNFIYYSYILLRNKAKLKLKLHAIMSESVLQ